MLFGKDSRILMISGYLPVSGGHTIYYEIHTKCTRLNPPTIVVLHGGPGGGLTRRILDAFDLRKCRVLLFDQRGCGKSVPFGKLEHNTTWDLVEDIEQLRIMMGVTSWMVMGGSWGTTLALAYAQKHTARVTGLVLRGVCLCDEDSFRWLYEMGGASEIFPDQWKQFVEVLPTRLHDKGWKEIATYYHTKLQGEDAQKYADAWWGWESAISRLLPDHDPTTSRQGLCLALLENHYFLHQCWLRKNQLLRNMYRLKRIPITIIHGRYDLVCPIQASFAMKERLPHVNLHIIPDAGHASIEPGIKRALKREIGRMLFPRRSTRKHVHIRAYRTLRKKKSC